MYKTTHTITIKRAWLSDGSEVYYVEIAESGKANAIISFDAVDKRAAYRLADQLSGTINDARMALATVEIRDQTHA